MLLYGLNTNTKMPVLLPHKVLKDKSATIFLSLYLFYSPLAETFTVLEVLWTHVCVLVVFII